MFSDISFNYITISYLFMFGFCFQAIIKDKQNERNIFLWFYILALYVLSPISFATILGIEFYKITQKTNEKTKGGRHVN